MDIYNVCNNDSVFIPSTMAIYGLQDCNSAKATLILRKLWANRGSLKAHEKLSTNICRKENTGQGGLRNVTAMLLPLQSLHHFPVFKVQFAQFVQVQNTQI